MKTLNVHGIDVFTDSQKHGLIADIEVKRLNPHADDRGYFTEIIKEGEAVFHAPQQSSWSETEVGVVKAFHWHARQWDIWFVVKGMAEIVLYDQRENSPTKGVTNTVVSSEVARCVIAIPPGVAHGYRVLGNERVGLVYYTTETYDPKNPDEHRIAWDDPGIGYNWETKNR